MKCDHNSNKIFLSARDKIITNTRRSRSDVGHWLTDTEFALNWPMWLWSVMIPLEDFTDVTLIIENTDYNDDDDDFENIDE